MDDAFSSVLRRTDFSEACSRAHTASRAQVQTVLDAPRVDSLEAFATLLSPKPRRF